MWWRGARQSPDPSSCHVPLQPKGKSWRLLRDTALAPLGGDIFSSQLTRCNSYKHNLQSSTQQTNWEVFVNIPPSNVSNTMPSSTHFLWWKLQKSNRKWTQHHKCQGFYWTGTFYRPACIISDQIAVFIVRVYTINWLLSVYWVREGNYLKSN